MKLCIVLPDRTTKFSRKPEAALDYFRQYLSNLKKESKEEKQTICPTRIIREMSDRGGFSRKLAEDEIRSYSQTLKNLARKEFGFKIASNKEAHETEAVQITTEALDKMVEELKKEDKSPKDCTIYPTLFAETLSTAYKTKVHAGTFRRFALKAGFKIANESESQILTSETEELKRLKDWARNKKKELLEQTVDPKTYKVFVTELKRELKISTGKTNIKEILLREGLGVAGQSAAQIKVRQTTSTARIRDHLVKLKEQLKALEIEVKDHTIYPAKVARELELDEDSYGSVIGYIAENEGFKTPDLSESMIDAKQTPVSKLIRDYYGSLKTKLKSIGYEPEDCIIYATEIARHLGLDPNKHRTSIIHIAQSEHFQTADISAARKRTFEVKKGHISLAIDGFPGIALNRNFEHGYEKRYERYLGPIEQVLDLLNNENSFAYTVFSLHAGFEELPISDKEIANKLKIDKERVNAVIHDTLTWIRNTLERNYKIII